jgi:hypothetical protein
MMGIKSVPKPSTLPAAVCKRKQKKMSDYYSTSTSAYVEQGNGTNSPRSTVLQIVGMQQVSVQPYGEDYFVDKILR